MSTRKAPTVRVVRQSRRSFWSWDMNPTTILTLAGVAVSGVLTYSNSQHAIADTGEKVKSISSELDQYRVDTSSSRDKYRTEVNASLDKVKTEDETGLEKLKAEDAANLERLRAEEALALAKVTADGAKLEEKINGIDKSGTDYGRSAYSAQNVERAQVRKDVDEMGAKLGSLIPTVTEISANVRWLMHAQGADMPGPDSPPILRHNPPKK